MADQANERPAPKPQLGPPGAWFNAASAADDALSASGAYTPQTTQRWLKPGAAQDEVAAMVSAHEAMHSQLNKSSAHGVAMVLAGSLSSLGYDRFVPALEGLLTSAHFTHEAFATTSALLSLEVGKLRRDLLDEFPDYRQFLGPFERAFAHMGENVLSLMTFQTCCVAAMHTDALERLSEFAEAGEDAEIPPSRWHRPDARFERVATPELADRARESMCAIIKAHTPSWRDDDSAGQTQFLLAAEAAQLDAAYVAGFETFALALRAQNQPTPALSELRALSETAVARIARSTGAPLTERFYVPTSPDDDIQISRIDYRQERLQLSHLRPRAVLHPASNYPADILDRVVIPNQGRPYAQLAAMPAAKLRALYDFIEIDPQLEERMRAAPLKPITMLRGRAAMRPVDRVDLVAIAPKDLATFKQRQPDVDVLRIEAASAAYDDEWRRQWRSDDQAPAIRVVDLDPFGYVQSLLRDNDNLQTGYVQVRFEDHHGKVAVGVICLFAPSQPQLLHVTPASHGLWRALLGFAQDHASNLGNSIEETNAFIEAWNDQIYRATVHLVREEGLFGSKFWL